MKIIYFGFNDFKIHKRGVENVIDFQSNSCDFEKIFYFHWGNTTKVTKHKKIICILIKHFWYWPIILNLVLYKLKKRDNLIIHSHNPLFTSLSIVKTDLFTVHDALYYLSKSKKQKHKHFIYIVEKILYLRCKIVHFISNYSKSQSLFGNSGKYVIIPNSSHFEKFVFDIKRENGIEKIQSILIVRSIEERARIDLVLDVAEKLKSKKFIVAGKGPLLEFYESEIEKRELNNVTMLGYVDDAKLLSLYKETDLVLMPAEYGEGFGLPIIEGYLFNKPVIASNKCAIPEIIFSENYLFENDNISIVNLINNISEYCRDDYYKYYMNKYSNSKILIQYRELYKSIIK